MLMLEPPYRRTRTGAADKYLIPVRRHTRDRHKGELRAQPGALSVYGAGVARPPFSGSARFRVRCMTCLPALSAPSGGPCVSPRTIPRARVRVTIPRLSACSLSVSSTASLSLPRSVSALPLPPRAGSEGSSVSGSSRIRRVHTPGPLSVFGWGGLLDRASTLMLSDVPPGLRRRR